MLPVKLVHGPCRDRRLGQCLYLVCFVAITGFLQPRREFITRAGEFCQREPEQRISVIVELASILRHAPSFSLISPNAERKAGSTQSTSGSGGGCGCLDLPNW